MVWGGVLGVEEGGGVERGSCGTWVGGYEPQLAPCPLESPSGPS